jgi:AcrR family transcriptional regulator
MAARSIARRAYHHGDLPNALVTAALRLIANRGVENFSLREAAREVGVDPAAAYRHFNDKGALLAEIAQRGFAAMARAMEHALLGRPEPWAQLHAVGRGYVRFALAERETFRVMFGPFGAEQRAGRCAYDGRGASGKTPYELLVSALVTLEAAGELRLSASAAALPAWAAVHGLAALIVDGASGLNSGAAVDAAIDNVIATLCAGIAAHPRPRSARRKRKLRR